jgi:hypothetical protein
MILCFERFDREPASQPAPVLGGTFPKCACASQGLFPIGDLAARQASLRVHVPLILLADRHGRLITRRARTTTS